MSRRRSRSEGSMGGRFDARREALVCNCAAPPAAAAEEGEVGRGKGGKSDCGREGMECRPMYENWSCWRIEDGSSEAELVSALRNERIANLFDKTGYC